FGMGGTNAHAVLEEAPVREPAPSLRGWHLLPLSARTGTALERAGADLAAFLRREEGLSLADAAFTLQVGRRPFPHRRAVVCRSAAAAAAVLEGSDPERVAEGIAGSERPPVVFMFPGQGAQHAGMGLGLYRTEPVFRAQVDRCAELLRPHLGLDLRTLLFPREEEVEGADRRLRETAITQPALFTVEYALAKLWMEWGVQPAGMIGHSIGEYVAACLAGVFTLEDALALVATRGRLMQSLPAGAMLSVALDRAELEGLLGTQLTVAAENAPGSCVVSGPEGAVEELAAQLAERGVKAKRLRTSHAFHSAMMDPILDAFAGEVRRVPRRAPEIPFLSNVTGTLIRPEEAADPAYWAAHLRQTVRFAAGLGEVLAHPGTVLLEVGPGQSLSALAGAWEGTDAEVRAFASMRSQQDTSPDEAVLLRALGALWSCGVEVGWEALYGDEARGRVRLPTYPFERERHWIEPPAAEPARVASAAPAPAAEPYTPPAGPDVPLAGPSAPRAEPSATEWLIEQQLQVMAQQLQLLGAHLPSETPAETPVAGVEPEPSVEPPRSAPEPAAVRPAEGDAPRAADAVPLTPVQHWFFGLELERPDHFNQTMLFEVHDRVELARLRRAVALLVERHDALRMRYGADEAGRYARPGASSGAFGVRYEELAGLAAEEQEAAVERVAAEAQASLSVSEGPLLRVVFFGRGQRPGYLLVVV
ncbi:MAG TPA: acyltransferase domain-containing protein, partial [Longimicrobiaceae bacterium]|nr:acyltransferase domain-containing protein [Longimicrobiaceae bacterium]